MNNSWEDYQYNEITHEISRWVSNTKNYIVADITIKHTDDFINPVLLISYYNDSGKDLCDLHESLSVYLHDNFPFKMYQSNDNYLHYPICWEEV